MEGVLRLGLCCGRAGILPGTEQDSAPEVLLHSSRPFLRPCSSVPSAPLPMAHIEKLAADCMRDVDEEEEEEGLEEDTDLLVRLPGWCTRAL